MLIYYFLFLLPVSALFFPNQSNKAVKNYFWFVIGLFFILIIGLRFEIGADWFSYMYYLERAEGVSLWNSYGRVGTDPAYIILNLIGANIIGGIFFVNIVSATIIIFCIIYFARKQPVSLLAFIVSVPYMIIVVSMGYSRQAIALGVELLAIIALLNGNNRKFVFYVLIAALFHKTAIILFPLAALMTNKNKGLTYFYIGIIFIMAFIFIVGEKQEFLYETYVERQKSSSGGMIRVFMNVVPALLLFQFKDRLGFDENEKKFWVIISYGALSCIPLLAVSSTVADRIGLYFIPLQIVLFSRLHYLASDIFNKNIIVVSVIAYYGLVLIVWLNFAGHTEAWIPYKNVIFQH